MKCVNLFFLICLFLTGCSAKKNVDSAKNVSDSSFEDFFSRFSTDSVFQVSRIKFPLEYSYYDDDSLSMDKINSEEWAYLDFSDDSLASKSEVDAYNIEFIEVDRNMIEYLRKGIDNGIFVSYRFRKTHGRWHLTEIVDRSN